MSDESYTEFMEEVNDSRALTYKILHEQYYKHEGKQKMIDDCVYMGVKYMNKESPFITNIGDAKRLLQKIDGMSEAESIQYLCDTGVRDIIYEKTRFDNATDFINKFKDQYKDEINKLSY